MTKDEQFALAKEKLLTQIDSWADLYDFFDASMEQVLQSMQPHVVFSALFSMYAFLQAMREAPEEGDIKVLAERMVYIMVYEGREKLGTEISFGEESVAAEQTAARLRQVVAAVAAEAISAYDSEEQQKNPKTLH